MTEDARSPDADSETTAAADVDEITPSLPVEDEPESTDTDTPQLGAEAGWRESPTTEWRYEDPPPAGPQTAGPATEKELAPAAGTPRRRARMGTVAITLVSALIGGGVVAAVSEMDDDNGASTSSADGGGGRANSSVITRTSDVQSILRRVEPGVLSIETEQFQRGVYGEIRRATGAGTGMVLTADGVAVTNAHVVQGAQRIEVTLSGEKDARPADLVGADASADVAVIKIRDASGLPTVRLGSSKELVVGDDVIAIGNALALAGGLSVTQGIVSAVNRTLADGDIRFDDLIQTDAAINNGNSGGPLVNAAGEVVGINTVVIQQSGGNLVQNVGFAIAIDSVKPLIEELRKGGTRRTAFLGVTSQTLDQRAAQELDLPVDEGALIITVGPGSPAEAAGLERFDVIVRFGDDEIASAEDLTAAVRKHEPGEDVEVRFLRAGRERSTTVTLGARQASAQ